MKLVSLVLATVLAGAGSARADDVLHPPSGAVEAGPPPVPQRPGIRGQQLRRQQLRRAMLDAFDADGDGRLGPRERTRAIRVLRRLEGRLAAPEMRDHRDRAARRFIRRFDLNRDGNVGPGEMPPAAADKLRHLDRDRDGWVEPDEHR